MSELCEPDSVVAEQARLIERQLEHAEKLLAAAEEELRERAAQAGPLATTNPARG